MKFRKNDENFAQANATAKEIHSSKDWPAVGELYAGVIDGPLEDGMIDVFADALGEDDMSETTRYEFETPEYVWGGKAMKYEFGRTIPVAKITKGKITVAPEYINTPAYEFDVDDLAAGDLVSVEHIREIATNELLREKNLRGLKLFTDGINTTATGMQTIVKSQDPSSDLTVAGDRWKWQVNLKTKLNTAVRQLQDMTSSGDVCLICRSTTLGDIEDSGFNLGQVRVLTVNAAVDPKTNECLFEEGDILLLGKGVGRLARVKDTQVSTITSDHFTVQYTFRQGHMWVRWQDRGYNVGRIRRVLLLNDVDDVGHPTIALSRFSTNGIEVRFSDPVDVTTLTSANIVVSASQGGAQADGVTIGAATVSGTLRSAEIAVAGLAAGTAYYVRFTAGVKDPGAQTFTAIEFGPITVN